MNVLKDILKADVGVIGFVSSLLKDYNGQWSILFHFQQIFIRLFYSFRDKNTEFLSLIITNLCTYNMYG